MKAAAQFTNEDDGITTFVFPSAASPDKFNVTMRDNDSGEFVPHARIGMTYAAAVALAQKWANVT